MCECSEVKVSVEYLLQLLLYLTRLLSPTPGAQKLEMAQQLKGLAALPEDLEPTWWLTAVL